MLLRSSKDRSPAVKQNAGASLIDLGDGVLAVEFHSKMNAIGGDTLQMLVAGVAEAERNVPRSSSATTRVNFSAGANLMLLLLEAQEGNWDEIDLMVRTFQATTSALRYARGAGDRAPAGLALGGGCEVALHGDRVQAAAETYMGLVEVGVGLIPAGGRHERDAGSRRRGAAARAPISCRHVQRVFETIGFAKVSTSALDARATRLPASRGRHLDEPRAAAVGRQAACARARPRGLSAAASAIGGPRRRRFGARGPRARRPPGAPRRPHQRLTTRSSAARLPGCSPAARCRTRRR